MPPITHVLELNGAGLWLAAPAGRAAAEPAWASFEHDTVLTGRAAAARARLAPLFASARYLEEPGQEPLVRPKPAARSHADLVYAQLAAFAASESLAGVPLLLAVSSAYTLDQLRLLLGIAAAARLAVTGLVDAAVAAAAAVPSTERALFLDLEMNRAVLTELVRGDGLRRGRVDLARDVGLRALEDALAQLVARTFVRATRFDPLHQAATEQAVYDRLPAWRASAAGGEAVLVLEHAGLRHEARLGAAQIAAASAPLNAELLRLVHSARRAGEALTLYLSARAAAVPGLGAELETVRDLAVVVLADGMAAAGALAHADEIEGPEPSLVSRLSAAGAVALAGGRAASAALTPTHVIYQGRAYALGAEPLLVGRAAAAGPRTIVLSGELAGVSRCHLALQSRDGDAVLEDLSTYGTFVNGERVQRRAHLVAGDRVRVGTPGVELQLVRLEG
jgi:hypothetical protein